MCDGMGYAFPPFSMTDVWDEHHAFHLADRNCRHKGLVILDPTKAEREQYKDDPAELMRKKALAGLEAALSNIHEAWVNEKQAERDVKEHTGAESHREIINPKRFEDMEKKIEGWISDVKDKKWSPAKYSDKKTAEGGREPWDYTGAGAAQAG